LSDAPLRIDIVYAEPQRVIAKTLHLPPGSCVADALHSAALDPDFSGVDLANAALGIFGKVTGKDQALQEGDRIEVYRPLAADPKIARRARAKELRKK
jgi:putative ubiquitin-RnfH superfamily antitoxin RatB of RatAB toxin-antitoxin module